MIQKKSSVSRILLPETKDNCPTRYHSILRKTHTLNGYGITSYILPSITAGPRLCLLSPAWRKISDSRSEASSKHPLHCLAPPDSSLQSSPNVLFLFIAFPICFTEIYDNKKHRYCQSLIFLSFRSYIHKTLNLLY